MFRAGDDPTYHRCLKIKPSQRDASWLGTPRPCWVSKRPLRRCNPLGTTAFFSAPPLAAPNESGSYHLIPRQSHSSPEQPARPAGRRVQPQATWVGWDPAGLAILNGDWMVPMEQVRQALKIEGPLFPAPTPHS